MPSFSPITSNVTPPSSTVTEPTKPTFAPALKQMMSVHERRLAHDVIQLKEELQKMKKDVEEMKLGKAAQRLLESDAPQGEVPKQTNTELLASLSRLAEMQSRAERSNAEQFKNIRDEMQALKSGSNQVAALQVVQDARDEARQENANAKKRLEEMSEDAKKRLEELESEAAGLRGQPDAVQPKSTSAMNAVNATAPREDSRAWAKTLELDAKVDVVFGELKLVALRTTRIALRAVDMSPEDRQAALQAVDQAVDQNEKQMDKDGGVIAGPGGGVPTPRKDFQTAITDITTLAMSPSVASRNPQYAAMMPGSGPQLCTVGDERRYFTGTVANTTT